MSNIYFIRSLSMIGSITSTREIFLLCQNTTNNSQVFKEYITKIYAMAWRRSETWKNKIIIITDNSPIYWSKVSLKNLDHLGLQVVFLSLYCPHFAPIEYLFYLLKVKAWKHSKNEVTDLSKEYRDRWIRKY